jgi:nitric oxide reductase large subunit
MNPYDPDSLAYHMYEAQLAREHQRNQQPLHVPTNLGEWMAGIGIVCALFGVFGPVGRDRTIINVALYMIWYGVVGALFVLGVYAVFISPKLIYQVVRWAIRKSVAVKSIVIGTITGMVLGGALGLGTGSDFLRGVGRLGTMGLVVGILIGIPLEIKRRNQKR